jgi:hypothetical protein
MSNNSGQKAKIVGKNEQTFGAFTTGVPHQEQYALKGSFGKDEQCDVTTIDLGRRHER